MSVRYDAGVSTAYGAAVDAGYTGTYEDFCRLLVNLLNIEAEATTLPEGSEATASYADGVLSFGIPRGNTGATGAQGEKGEKGDTGATGNGIASIAKTATEGLVDTYTITFTDGSTTTFEITNGEDGSVTPEQMADAIATALENYATTDGTYEDMAVGELISSNANEDTEPYIFRKTGGSTKAGKREYLNKIVGVSLVENQLESLVSRTVTGISYTKNDDGSITISGTSTSVSILQLIPTENKPPVGHKVLVKRTNEGQSPTVQVSSNINRWDSYIYTQEDTNIIARLRVPSGVTVDLTLFVQIIDLTVMFGTTIADYVYNLETATAGAGIEWLSQYMDLNKYIPFTENTLKHVEGLVSHDMTELNQWNEDWEVGTYGNNAGILAYGGPAYTTMIRSKTPIRVLPNTTYTFFCNDPNYNAGFYVWESEGIGKPVTGINNVSSGRFMTYTTTAKATHLVFATRTGYGNVYKHDVSVHIRDDGAKDQVYEPYVKHSYPLDSSVVLRGIPTLVDEKMVNDGDEYAYDGTVNRRYKLVLFDGGLNGKSFDGIFGATDNGYAVYCSYMGVNRGRKTVSDKFVYSPLAYTRMPLWSYGGGSGASSTWIFILPSTVTSLAEANQWARNNPFYVLIPQVSTTENADPYQQVQICDPYGTEEFVGAEIPVGTVTEYPEDLTAKIEGLPWDLSMIAPIENGTTASQAYTAGQYFLRNNVFCKALTAIASGATFTLNTNYTETTVANELYSALHS